MKKIYHFSDFELKTFRHFRFWNRFLEETDFQEQDFSKNYILSWKLSLKTVPMGCKEAVLPKQLLRYCTINCLKFEQNKKQPYNDNLCPFRSVAFHLHGNEKLEDESSKTFILFLSRMDELNPSQFPGLHMNNIPSVDDLLFLNIFRYEVNIVERNNIRELVWRSVQKYENTVRILRYNFHTCYVSNINEVFQCFRCPNCNMFFERTFNLEQHLTTSSERVKKFDPGNVYQIRETLFDKQDSFALKCTSEQKLLENSAMFDFESICVQEETSKGSNPTTWIRKQIPLSVCFSSYYINEPSFRRKSDPHHLVASFIRVQ